MEGNVPSHGQHSESLTSRGGEGEGATRVRAVLGKTLMNIRLKPMWIVIEKKNLSTNTLQHAEHPGDGIPARDDFPQKPSGGQTGKKLITPAAGGFPVVIKVNVKGVWLSCPMSLCAWCCTVWNQGE